MDATIVQKTDRVINIDSKEKPRLALKLGDVVKGEVVRSTKGSKAGVRLKGKTLEVKTALRLRKGEALLLKVVRSAKDGGELRLRLINSKPLQESAFKDALLNIIKRLSLTKMAGSEISVYKKIVSQMNPDLLKKVPDLKLVADYFQSVDGLTGTRLKESVEQSGLFFESRLSKALSTGTQVDKALSNRLASISNSDLKGALLRIQEAFKDLETRDLLEKNSIKLIELAEKVDSILKHIEFSQIQSKMTDSINLFMPFFWNALREGDLSFSESVNQNSNKKSYSCTVNLDLESAGRVSVVVLLMYGSVHISFVAEKEEFVALLDSNLEALQEQFKVLDLTLGSVNAVREPNIDFTKPREVPFGDGFNITI